ncbi:hypothetical protein GCM10010123_39090 [Pilimelia anulata]|uniref:HlyD family secretion protein n=1 Tax=Pilimelia anulata TaxID=53371 RepID=A0A8J3B9J6_9ACTN|nr:HlyD family efflux transporter periplasmic adaptor subunit [Pilimelia anulata]GGK05404.1 hypothetical protein GCM10010123_39090 [Pilimelia anulata]
MTRALFRSRAMTRSADPEKLDERVRVVTVPGWIALAVALVVAVSVLSWAWLGTTRSQVTGTALLVRAPHTFTAESPVYGFVVDGPPAEGSRVEQGQRIGTVRAAATAGTPLVPVLAPVSGTVISGAAERGTVVVPGQDLAYLEAETGPLVAQAFVPTAEGKRVVKGMSARVEPSTAPSAVYGWLLADVTAVSSYTVTPDRVRTVVGHGAIADGIVNGPPVLLVTLALQPAGAGGRYRWTSGDGPPFAVGSGTLATAAITVSSSRPIDTLFGRGR